MKKKFISFLTIFLVLFLWGESNYLAEWAEYRDLDGGIKGGTDTKADFDSLNVAFVGNWPFGPSYAVTKDTIRDVCFLGSGGGVYILDVSNNSSPIKLSEKIHTRGIVRGLYYDDTKQRLYIAAGEGGLEIWDVSNLSNPVKLSCYFTPDSALDVYVSGRYAYVVDYGYGLRVIDINSPTNPIEVGYYYTPGACKVYVLGRYAYVADYDYGLRIINISNPTSPTSVGYYDTPGYASGVYVSGSYAYVADWDYGLRIINISNPTNPTSVGYYDTPGFTEGVYVSGSYAYVADDDRGMQIYTFFHIHLSFPDGGQYFKGGDTLTITWESTEEDVKIEYSIDGGSSWNVITSSTINDGEYKWTIPKVNSVQCRVRVSDVSNPSLNDMSDNNFTIDSSKPKITSVYPEDNTIITTARPTIKVKITDNLSGVITNWPSNVSITLDGVDITNMVTLTDSMISYTPSTDLSESLHTMYVYLEDKAGNSVDSTWSFRVDSEEPLITSLLPTPNSYSATRRPKIEVRMESVKKLLSKVKEGSGLDSCYISLDGMNITSLSTITDSVISYTPTADLTDTLHRVYVYIRDKGGNYSDSTWSFWVDGSKPIIVELIPTPNSVISDLRPTIKAKITDNLSGVITNWPSNVSITLDGVDITNMITLTDSMISYTPSTDLSESLHTMYVYLEDKAGNSVDSTWSFVVSLSGVDEIVVKGEIKDNYYKVENERQIELYFGVSKESKLDVSIYDKTGRELKKLYDGKIEKGYRKVTINKQDYPTGEYFIKGMMGKTEINTKVLILR